MTRNEVQDFALKRPFEPFELRMVDGHRYRFDRLEQFLVSRHHVLTLDRRWRTVFISLGLISAIGPVTRESRRRPRKPRRR